MDELLRERIMRGLEGLDDEQARKVLDYVEFVQSKYGNRSKQPSTLKRIADGVEDTLRVGKVPFAAIKGTRSVLNTADKIVKGMTDAGRAVVDEIQSQIEKASEEGKKTGEQKEAEGTAQTDEQPPASEQQGDRSEPADANPEEKQEA